MIACDNPACPFQWFHQDCLNGKNKPSADESDDWYCDECLAQVREHERDVEYGIDGKVTYNGMIAVALRSLPNQEGTFEEICRIVERRWAKYLNWKFENDTRKTPVWRSSVRKIILSNSNFKKTGSGGRLFTFSRKSTAYR